MIRVIDVRYNNDIVGGNVRSDLKSYINKFKELGNDKIIIMEFLSKHGCPNNFDKRNDYNRMCERPYHGNCIECWKQEVIVCKSD